MKQSLLFLGCLTLLAAGCNKVQTVEVPEEEIPELKFNVTVTYDDGTRAVKRGWEEGDCIYLAFDISFMEEVETFPTHHSIATMKYVDYYGDGNLTWVNYTTDLDFLKALLSTPSGKLAALYIADGRTPQIEYEGEGMTRLLNMTNKDRLGGVMLMAHEVPYTMSGYVMTADINVKLYSDEYHLPVHFFLPGITASKAGNYSLRCTKLQPERFNAFTYLDMSQYQMNNLGPWASGTLDDFGTPLYGSYYDGGLEFVGYLDRDAVAFPSDYYLVVVDNNGTPDNPSDDVYRGMAKKNAVLNGKEAIRLPELTNTSKWKVFTPSGIDPVFDGINSTIKW